MSLSPLYEQLQNHSSYNSFWITLLKSKNPPIHLTFNSSVGIYAGTTILDALSHINSIINEAKTDPSKVPLIFVIRNSLEFSGKYKRLSDLFDEPRPKVLQNQLNQNFQLIVNLDTGLFVVKRFEQILIANSPVSKIKEQYQCIAQQIDMKNFMAHMGFSPNFLTSREEHSNQIFAQHLFNALKNKNSQYYYYSFISHQIQVNEIGYSCIFNAVISDNSNVPFLGCDLHLSKPHGGDFTLKVINPKIIIFEKYVKKFEKALAEIFKPDQFNQNKFIEFMENLLSKTNFVQNTITNDNPYENLKCNIRMYEVYQNAN